MPVPFVVFLISLAGLAGSILIPGPLSGVLFPFFAVCLLAATILILIARRRRQERFIVVDGSNVMHWQDGQARIETVRKVLQELSRQGYVPVVWFDANAGYKIGQRYLGPHALAKALGISARQVFVAPKGTPADPLLLAAATHLQARVVTNDRFRDWVSEHPQIEDDGFLIFGAMRQGEVRMRLSEP
ncbi:hypothetical protein ACFMPD_05680 [Sedimentitalea sp. HM32M-2]